MLRLNDKWFPLLLAILLGMAPFVRAYADIATDNQTVVSGMHGSSHHAAMQDGNCDKCKTAHNCGTSSCSCYQCGTCSVTILHEPLSLPHTDPTPLIASSDVGMLTTHPFLLFRPPRA